MNDKNIRVLVVDDIYQVRDGLKTVLSLAAKNNMAKVEVIGEAQNGMEAIRQASILQPDVILMDLEMPLMDGYEATRRIKEIQPAVRVIILSIHDSLEEQEYAHLAGAENFLTKGCSYKVLLKAIQAADKPNHSKKPDKWRQV